ncbi:DUF2642 domain-containing protein [Fictibacillus phosphorivorans]|uniref:DUF2642 domain-containing protein n=1 Tax=Fictibacillus phosphorivorans TaxID=1221500 RepID=UPI00203D3024|nr:DUF2642 domain-containing protein [Fictibacillus phosphorivorans]MCM3717551.1 DUF2642 domain-containing protein [Fictibacillus phosphorivorans]MCM3775246.1 DUF2642 domain-containing protein [Fictibacillus phosphorivorans]
MNHFSRMLNKQIQLKITGNRFKGILTDYGNDILVLFDGQTFFYIPLMHVQKVILSEKDNDDINKTEELLFSQEDSPISYRSILNNAKGLNIQVHILGKETLHGTILHVLSDYIVFYSPVYKLIYIPLAHLKWLTLHEQHTPYSLQPNLPDTPSFSRSFEEQLKKFEDKIAVFDMGEDPDKIGLLKNGKGNLIELINANGETVYFKLNHVKSVYFP